MAGQLCTNCHAPLDTAGAAPGAAIRCAYCKTENRMLGAGMAHPASPGLGPPPGFGPPPASPGFGPPPASPGLGGGFGPPPGGGFGAPPGGGFGAPPGGVIGGPSAPSMMGMNDANPKGWVAPPPSVVVPSSAGSNAELLGGIGALLAWKGLMAIVGLIIPALCCVSWIALQFFVGALGH